MKRELLIFLVFLELLVVIIQSKMTNKERQNLLNKATQKIDKDFQNVFNKSKSFYHDEFSKSYDPSKIKEILNKYDFPLNYNFFNSTNITPIIKNQDQCGSCWAFASTSALAYRYNKLGFNVSLSPQYLLSCYLNQCDEGEYIINAQFALVTYGTVTEECLPYSSGEGVIVDECPSTCKNKNEDMKIYYAKNAYSTQLDYYTGDYYDVVTIILDQLINYGPVVSQIDDYEDFNDLYDAQECPDIYEYDGESEFYGTHTVVIVGYGYEEQSSKFYWIIQNSWGLEFCGNGFAKIGFGEISVERVSFSEPYIPENNATTSKKINAIFTQKDNCYLEFNIGMEEIKDSFKLFFQNVEKPDSEFYYQCNLSPEVNTKNEGTCNYDMGNIFSAKGYYKYKNYSSIRNENEYNFNFSSLPKNNQFYYYGIDYIDYIYENFYFVSEEGSSILLYYESDDDLGLASNIYPNENIKTSLSDCKIIPEKISTNYTYIYCRLKKEEIQYFENDQDLSMTYDIFCGAQEPANLFVYKLDKTKNPLFRVKYFVSTQEKCQYCEFKLVANIEGSIKELEDENSFFVLVNINSNDNSEKLTESIYCEIPKLSEIQDNYEISCVLFTTSENSTETSNVELTPYYIPYNFSSPFEIFIENNIKSIKYEDYQNIIAPSTAETDATSTSPSKEEEKEEENENTIGEILVSIFTNPIFIASISLIALLSIVLKLLL